MVCGGGEIKNLEEKVMVKQMWKWEKGKKHQKIKTQRVDLIGINAKKKRVGAKRATKQ